jgi:hypothetical protein
MSFNVPLAESLPDISYVRANFAPLEQLCANRSEFVDDVMSWVHARAFPLPTYLLEEPGGSTLLMYPPDVFALVDEAVQGVRRRSRVDKPFGNAADQAEATDFAQRNEPRASLSRSLAGVRRGSRLDSLAERVCRQTLLQLQRVDALDTLERPFAECDRRFFGGPTSRDRCITAPRALYLQIES